MSAFLQHESTNASGPARFDTSLPHPRVISGLGHFPQEATATRFLTWLRFILLNKSVKTTHVTPSGAKPGRSQGRVARFVFRPRLTTKRVFLWVFLVALWASPTLGETFNCRALGVPRRLRQRAVGRPRRRGLRGSGAKAQDGETRGSRLWGAKGTCGCCWIAKVLFH